MLWSVFILRVLLNIAALTLTRNSGRESFVLIFPTAGPRRGLQRLTPSGKESDQMIPGAGAGRGKGDSESKGLTLHARLSLLSLQVPRQYDGRPGGGEVKRTGQKALS